MKREHLVARIIVLIVGLWIMALGVAFSIQAGMGTSPISGVPYTLSLITPLSVGMLTICMHCTFVLIQILLLRKKYQPIQLLQLPIAIIFGFMTDAAVYLVGGIAVNGYFHQLLFCLVGILLVAIGVSAEVQSETVPLAGEGLAIALSTVTGIKFGTTKVAVDCTLVIIALTLSLIFLHSNGGVREGTVLAALLVGTIAGNLNRLVAPLKAKYL